MKQPKRMLALRTAEYRLALYGLLHFRNKPLQQGGYANPVNELLMKLQKARRCRHG